MKAIITIHCANGENKINCKSWELFDLIVSRFDQTGTDYSVEYICQK
jgi:hypothetical protein